ncbi:MAG: acyltransferase [Flavobacteriales bacterium]|nr:acyltransferase [Flavobacteriales bacterium]
MQQRAYFENLDGLRFLAFLTVFFYHASYYFKPKGQTDELFDWIFVILTLNGQGGKLGVAFFFVLSGFLITHLILVERDKPGGFHIGKFYLRRILRIWPLYYISILIGFFIVPFTLESIGLQMASNEGRYLNFFFFLANYDIFVNGYPNPALGVQWSLAIEEQFYIIWPVVFGFLSKRLLPIILPILIGISFAYYSISTSDFLDYHSLAALMFLASGGMLSILARNQKFKSIIANLPKLLIVLIYIVMIVFTYFNQAVFVEMGWSYSGNRGILALTYALFFVFIIAEQNYGLNSPFKLVQLKRLSRWGRELSYGAYLFHMLPILTIYVCVKYFHITFTHYYFWSFTLGALIVTLLLSRLFYLILERPFLKLKTKFSA